MGSMGQVGIRGAALRRETHDFHEVRVVHLEIHERLNNWARWARDGRGMGNVSPMFRHYKPYAFPEAIGGSKNVDTLDAVAIQKLFSQIPEKNRWAIQWSYLFPFINAGKVCRHLAVTRIGLSDLIHDSRTMMKNNSCRRESSVLGSAFLP
jgi:hypothetical protein